MNGRRAKENRKISADAKRQALAAVQHPVNTALVNTSDLNDRVSDLEAWARAFSNASRWTKLRWLLKGG